MASPFDLALVIETILVATARVWPNLIDNFGITAVYDTIVALNPVVSASWITALLIAVQVFVFLLSGSFAWNDRLWSLIPPVYACLYGIHPVISQDRRTGGSFDTRLSVMCCLIIMWGARLTFNAARRGFYSPNFVDYRYEWVRTTIVKNRYLFGLVYVSCCFCLTILLALVASPLYFAWIRRGLDAQLTYLDGVASVGMIACIALQTIADNQQYAFQKKKAAWFRKSESQRRNSLDRNMSRIHKEFEDGFLQSGLFSCSRHPNFFAEVAIWWFFYIFSVSASRRWLNWALMGPILYTSLFQITTPLTEHISAQKYPAYRRYQQRTSRLIPIPFSLTSSTHGSEEESKKRD